MGISGRYFTHEELRCKCGQYCDGENKMKPETVERLDLMRGILGRPVILSSAYRCPAYNAAMGYTKAHETGGSADVVCSGGEVIEVLIAAKRAGFKRFGVKQHGPHDQRFVHIDDLTEGDGFPSPVFWSYK